MFDQALFVEHDGKRFGPFEPSRGAVPLYRYRKYQRSRAEERLGKVVSLADQLGLPRATITGGDRSLPSLPPSASGSAIRTTPFPVPVIETTYATGLAAPQMEEIGYRTTSFEYEGIGANPRRLPKRNIAITIVSRSRSVTTFHAERWRCRLRSSPL